MPQTSRSSLRLRLIGSFHAMRAHTRRVSAMVPEPSNRRPFAVVRASASVSSGAATADLIENATTDSGVSEESEPTAGTAAEAGTFGRFAC
jgi:hypothetical protein